MILGETEKFIGRLEGEQHDHVRLLRRITKDYPLLKSVFQALRQSGARDRNAFSLEENVDRQIELKEINLRPISHHDWGVVMVAYGLSSLLGLEHNDGEDFTTAAGFHDATKPIEINVKRFRELLMVGSIPQEIERKFYDMMERAGVRKILSYEGIIALAQIPGELKYEETFNKRINIPWLRQAFAGTSIPEERKDRIIKIASSDGNAEIPLFIARTNAFSHGLPEDDVVARFRSLVRKLRQEKKLPEVAYDMTSYLGMMLLMCDGMTKGSELTTLDGRHADILKRGFYGKLDEEARSFYGMPFFDAVFTAEKVVERIAIRKGIQQGSIDPSTKPGELPKVILQHLRNQMYSQ